MTATLLLRCAGPLQSWGTRSRFTERDTEREPTKSGIVGVLGAALGRPRDAGVADLAALRMGVRVDREGTVLRDFHTAQGVLKAKDMPKKLASLSEIRKRLKGPATVSHRYYLSDAVFLVGLEGEQTLLEKLHGALRGPVHSLFLGRKSFLPSPPVYLADGLAGEPLEEALCRYPWLGKLPRQRRFPEELRTVIEVAFGDDGLPRKDYPVDFARRQFAERRVRAGWVSCPPARESGNVPCI